MVTGGEAGALDRRTTGRGLHVKRIGMPPASVPITPVGAVAAATMIFRESGQTRVVAIVKATFAFVHHGPMPLVAPEPILSKEAHRMNNPTRSIVATSDLVPRLPAADVLLLGHAHAPGGSAAHMEVRLVVGRGESDGARQASGARRRRSEGRRDRAVQGDPARVREGVRRAGVPRQPDRDGRARGGSAAEPGGSDRREIGWPGSGRSRARGLRARRSSRPRCDRGSTRRSWRSRQASISAIFTRPPPINA